MLKKKRRNKQMSQISVILILKIQVKSKRNLNQLNLLIKNLLQTSMICLKAKTLAKMTSNLKILFNLKIEKMRAYFRMNLILKQKDKEVFRIPLKQTKIKINNKNKKTSLNQWILISDHFLDRKHENSIKIMFINFKFNKKFIKYYFKFIIDYKKCFKL